MHCFNIERQKVGHDPLKEDGILDKGATIKADDMRDKRYFSHTSPTYGTAFKQMNILGVHWKRAGENIASGYKTPDAVVNGWMKSPGHPKKCPLLGIFLVYFFGIYGQPNISKV